MKRETLKYIGLGLIAVVLLAANINMVYKTFFAKNRLNLDLKQPANITNAEIQHYADSLFVHKDSLQIIEDDMISNKRVIITNGDTLGFAFIVYESIPCPSCSDVNYVLFTDNMYTIKNIIFLYEIVEDYKIVPLNKFKEFSNQLIGTCILKDEFLQIKALEKPKKYSKYFSESINKLQDSIRLFYEK